jgi:beta-N-acetylhexosaminidase
MVKEGLPVIMSGHLAFPQTPAGETPASLSSWFLGDLLRDKLSFKGVIITDDLIMYGASAATGSLWLSAKKALLAGNDMILISSTPALNDMVWTSLLRAMKEEPAFRNRVREAAKRVTALKLEYLRGERAAPVIPDIDRVKDIPNPEAGAFFLDLAVRSVTMVKSGALPLSPGGAGRVLLAGRRGAFFAAGRKAFPGSAEFVCEGSGSASELGRLTAGSDTVIFCLEDREDAGLLESIRRFGKRVIVFSVSNPALLDPLDWTDTAAALYSSSAESFIAGFSAILGRFKARGRLP